VNGRASSAINGIRWGLTNGASKGGGIVNGFVNGSGAVNGFRLSYGQRKLGTTRIGFKRKLAIVAIFAIIIAVTPYAIVYSFPSEVIEIDGYFIDWLKVQKYHDTPDSENPAISIAEYAMKSGAAEPMASTYSSTGTTGPRAGTRSWASGPTRS